ncbi:HlyD family secretion protein [Luteimonas sp. FCS-9]|uniref:HlyD family secretion protein n=1 Tax=Luteimonas sp. FCS-9 TaxID=1547516 RepID=UPI00063E8B66|nr:HlyD family secretion protein [Luteimonas sp. FCS-9]KLJ02578.1 hypothetical protein WQ56_02790 [Luteimonas sp. FCS-9]
MSATPPPPPSPPEQPAAPSRRWRALSVSAFAAVALAGVLLVLYAWRLPPFGSAVQSTENATVRGRVTLIAPQVSGYVTRVAVQDFEAVRRGQLLATIDDRIYRQRFEQAQANLRIQQAALANAPQSRRSAQAAIARSAADIAATRAQSDVAAIDLRRIEALADQQLVSQHDRDLARASSAQARASAAQARASLEISEQQAQTVDIDRESLEAAVASAEAAVRLAKIDLDNTRIVAPEDGLLGQVAVRQGALVNAGTQLMAIVPSDVWVVANMKETQMADMRVGQAATFTVDALGGARLTGRVERIAPATGSEFSVLPADNATGNFVKIAQRIPVRIAVDPDQPLAGRLRPGMSVVVSVDTATSGEADRGGSP